MMIQAGWQALNEGTSPSISLSSVRLAQTRLRKLLKMLSAPSEQAELGPSEVVGIASS
jgi:hypothetical protein